MVEFKTSYYSPLDRGYNPPVEVFQPDETVIQDPIFPIEQLGQTVPESDPRTGAHILQNINAAIRAGAGNIQIVMTTPSSQPIGGRAKSYGKEVREAIREVAQSSGVVIEGVEMPTSSMTNLSGYDPQHGAILEQKRQQDLEEVRDAIKFVADIAGGGEVDVWSQEFPRTIFDAKWNKKVKDTTMFYLHPSENELAVKHLVDDRTGRIIEEIRLNQVIFYPEWNKNEANEYVDRNGKTVKKGDFIDYEGNKLEEGIKYPKFDPEKNTFIVKKRTFDSFAKEAEEENRKKEREEGRPLTDRERISTEEAFMRASMDSSISIARGWASYHQGDMREQMGKLKQLRDQYERELNTFNRTPEDQRILLKEKTGEGLGGEQYKYRHEILKQHLDHYNQRIMSAKDMVTGQLREAETLIERKDHIITPEKYAKEKTIASYAEMGIYAMNETDHNPKVTKPIYVGPELGWPHGFGGHPDEFIEIVTKAREKMAQRLKDELHLDGDSAKRRAEVHIQGVFDTSHLGMWLNHFRRIPGESEEKRMKQFNEWFMEQSEKLAKSGTVGAIQAVDSASGAHGHLPPGQGIFPVVESVNTFRKNGFKGAVISEGHEEERFGAGRILMQTWKAFGSTMYTPGGEPTGLPFRFPEIHEQYHRFIQPAYFTRQDYAPDQREWTLWSQAPLE